MLASITLRDQLTCVTLAPQMGGSIKAWQRLADGRALLRPGNSAATSARQLGCYPLIPWSNRIAGGGFDTPEGWQALPANTEGSPLAVHGSAWQQPWQVLEQDRQAVLLRLRSQVPFAYQAEQLISLRDDCLSIELTVTHQARRSAWHGLGLHPYFPRSAATRVQARARQAWLCDAERLSTQQVPIPPEWDLHQARPLPQTLVDNAFSGWDGRCRIVQEDAGYSLECQAQGFGLFLLYCPTDQPFFCFEPVSHPVNAHHLPGRPGLILLQQGQSQRASWRMRYCAD